MEKAIKKTIAYLSLLIILLYVLTGYGITKSNSVTKMTSGILTKSRAITIHTNLLIPLIILLLAHIILTLNLIPFRTE